MRETFFTYGRELFDPGGEKVFLRGVNKMSVWDEGDPRGEGYFAEIRKTQANSVRIVWAIRKDLKPSGDETDVDTLDALVTNARKHQLIPMVELHDATGQWERLHDLVDYWVRPEVVGLIEKHQAYLLVNIGNEVGDGEVESEQFTSGYQNAVKRMRAAGIHTPLVIDASDWGKDLDILNATAGELIQADPDQNLIFSVHLYWPVSACADAKYIRTKLHDAVALGYPLIVGEFSKYGGFAGEDEGGHPRSICGEFGEIDYRTILEVCDEKEIGWYAWEWGPGNAVDDPLCASMDMSPDGRFDHLKDGWATDVADHIKRAAENGHFSLEPVPEPSALQTRIETLRTVLSQQREQDAVSEALRGTEGDWPKALAGLKEKQELPAETLRKLALAHSLAVWSDDEVPLVKALTDDPAVASLRDVALHFNVEKLAALVDPHAVPENAPGATLEEKRKNHVLTLQHKLFAAEPTAVLQRMVRDAEVPIVDPNLRRGVTSFLSNQPDFNIRTTSILIALKHPGAFEGIADEHRPAVVENLKTLQRVQAISPVPEAVPVLMKANLTSAFRVAEMSESTFLSAHRSTLGAETARQVYTIAINAHIRNEHALVTMRDAIRGPAIMGSRQPLEIRLAQAQALVDQKGILLNLETLFGSIDFCECGECLSVYSPAAYFVDILQYLRNNNLEPGKTKTDPKDITGTPLEKLFRRRPDLGCLELTCENTFTVLPYIDLVNEVMESFVVNLRVYHDSTTDPKQDKLDVFNVEDETTGELLAQPQHVNYLAYCILKNAVYPFTLPYHQPIDAARIWLKQMGTSRHELLDTFRTATEAFDDAALTGARRQELQTLHAKVLDRAAGAEFLGITQEEYIILTREAFWPKDYFDLTLQTAHTRDEYRKKIGVRPVQEYYGYRTEAEMLSLDETSKVGLTFVKKQFLPRTGIQYVDLVELLKTRFINPAYPQGRALTILESIRFSYRFLQKLVDPDTTKSSEVRFAKLVDFLNTAQLLVPQVEALLHLDLCHQQSTVDDCVRHEDFRNWVYCYFERIGKLIVLESGEGPQLPLEGQLLQNSGQSIGTLHKDGTITSNKDGSVIGNVTITGQVVAKDGTPFINKFGTLNVVDIGGNFIGFVGENGLIDVKTEKLVVWLPARDTCDLNKVRLTHLDGSSVDAEEYDRMQRFIRLWHKLGWTIDETDHALTGLSTRAGVEPGECGYVGFDTFSDKCAGPGDGGGGGECVDGNGDGGNCPDISKTPKDISTDFLHQLEAVRKLLDLTGLPLDKLLSFWDDINTAGDKSLYARLFLTHNLLAIDKVFEPDTNGNHLARVTRISEHLPVLMAALKLKADDIKAVMEFGRVPDVLTPASVSALYRHSLLAKILHVRVADLSEVISLFGDPFRSARHTLALLDDWGKMEDAGFTFRQLDYLIRDHDGDPRRPLAPPKRGVLQISKALYDGLNAIDRDHADVPAGKEDEATTDLVRAKAGLLYEQSVVERIVGLLEGSTVYTTNAPANLAITIPDELSKRLKYNNQKEATPPAASVQLTGILTAVEKANAKSLSNDQGWSEAIDRAGKQAHNFFTDVLFGVFAKTDEALARLLAGDVNLPPNPEKPLAADANTAPAKRLYFLRHFLPFLRRRLAHRLIVDTLAGAVGLPGDITDVLLSDILTVGTPAEPAMSALQKIKEKPASSPGAWEGYLIPAADGAYTFIATSETRPEPLVVDGEAKPFPHRQDDPSDVWSTDPFTLKAGTLFRLETGGLDVSRLQWKTDASPKAAIPASALLPDYSTLGTEKAFVKLSKAALLVNGFKLSAEEVSYWQSHPADFDGFDLNAVTLQHWRRLRAYTALRDKLPRSETSLLALFKWAGKPGDAAKLSAKIAAATLWKQGDVEKLIAPEHFALDRPEAFRNEVHLLKLQTALRVAEAVGTEVERLFAWANPVSRFWVCHRIAEEIRAGLRARYDQEDWEQVVKPLNDRLREDQKQALISYLLVQQDLIDWGVVDADSLFEFFLIDVQMDACMETSRVKQAISTVQLFVQRCLLDLEAKYGVPNTALDRDRWEWMQNYRVWEANRKVFLYPENWIKSELRDDKSQFYKELESELLQKDINKQTVEDALKSYLFKVDEVANLKVVGLFLEQGTDKGGKPVVDVAGKPVFIKLHVFARTRNAPYFFFYRYFHVAERNWYPWEKMQVDIPSWDVEDADGNIMENGSYLIPVVWNKRLLIFFPQFTKKTLPGNADPPVLYWEIKMAWSEYRNGKWTQKQLTADAIYESPAPKPLPEVSKYEFIPRIFTGSAPKVVIDVYREAPALGSFQFPGSQLSLGKMPASPKSPAFDTRFHYRTKPEPPGTRANSQFPEIHTLQAIGTKPPDLLFIEPYFSELSASGVSAGFEPRAIAHNSGPAQNFFHPFAHELLGKLAGGGLDTLFDYFANNIPDDSGKVPRKAEAFGGDPQATVYHELKRPYSLYNWEAAFHAPMLLADRLLSAKQFDQALKMCHHVLNPYAQGTDDRRFWQFSPFKEMDSTNVLEKLFQRLQPNQPDNTAGSAIEEWRNSPFQPHAVARSRPSAYMKWVAMKYIEILIAQGDHYFRQNTLETVPLAIQCYVLASHVYGPHGQKIPRRGKTLPQTYNSLLDKWDAFGNAMVELELVFPFSNQTPLPVGMSNGVVGLANVFGFGSTLYFCIPDNPQLRALRDTIDDRLFKIRHCQDIDGVVRHLPLFEPPIDPALLVQAAAQGLSLSSVLNDLNSPMPNYRFYYLLQKALELCSELKSLGSAFLSAKEKGDAEALSRLRATHESRIHNLVMEVKKQQLDEAGKSKDALQQSRKGPVYRLQHYLKLIGEDAGKVPGGETDFGELPNQIEQPIEDGGLKLTQYEKEEMDKAAEANDKQEDVGSIEVLASILHALPTATVPLGFPGFSLSFGGSNGGSAAQAVARSNQMIVGNRSFSSTNAGRKANFVRQLQDRVLQANVAGYEIKSIDRQVLTQQIRINIARQEIDNQQKQIDNAQEMEEFLRNKYTNDELYSWMDGQIRGLYYQAYTLAFDLAKRAEKVFRFERGLTTSDFIRFGYWDIAHEGLMAGERLYIGLKQLEAAHQEKRGHDYEVTKSISLRQLDPLALIRLKETGACEFSLPEVLFDMDYPGHYMRRLKSAALRIPCVLGTHTSLNCTLRLLEHKFRTSAIAKDKNDYLEKTDETDDRFSIVNVPVTSIAVSSLEDENGVFELNFHDERYLPFEGAGVISKWRVELPKDFRQFDYDTITDVVVRLRYTTLEGGDKLRKPASDAVLEYIKSVEELSREEGLFAAFDLRNDFPNEWYAANHPPAGATERVLTIEKLNEKLPLFTKGRPPAKIKATDIYLLVSGSLPASSITATQGGNKIPFTDGQAIGAMKTFVARDADAAMDSLQIKIQDTKITIDKMWLLERYVLI